MRESNVLRPQMGSNPVSSSKGTFIDLQNPTRTLKPIHSHPCPLRPQNGLSRNSISSVRYCLNFGLYDTYDVTYYHQA